jgi:hypothetical protein
MARVLYLLQNQGIVQEDIYERSHISPLALAQDSFAYMAMA